MKEFSAHTRLQNIERLSKETFDLVIIGGGITGAGVARDAASRGMRVALIEKNDFASGTSSKSSKLIHGGIRYLENGHLGLVFEALSERETLFKIAPHLVHPLQFLIPIYQDSRVGMLKMSLGMWLYDILSLFRAPKVHKRLPSSAIQVKYPLLKSDNLLGGFEYFDAYMDDDRLVIETLRSANNLGAVIVNHAKALKLEENQLIVMNCQTKKSFPIQAKHVVSSVGPWTDELGPQLLQDWKRWLRPSRGIHLTFSNQRIPLPNAVVLATAKDKRIVFAIPRYEMVIIGTTDTDYDGPLDDLQASSEEISYLLEVANHYFPGAALSTKDILNSYAGVRPLIRDDAVTAGKTSREHLIRTYLEKQTPVTFVAGGKYTTYRLMAEQVVNECLRYFSLDERMGFGPSQTKEPLNDLVTETTYPLSVDGWSKRYDLPADQLKSLAQRYGKEALRILDSGNPRDTLIQREAYFCLRNTMCMTVEDFLERRTHLNLSEPDHGERYRPLINSVFEQYNRLLS